MRYVKDECEIFFFLFSINFFIAFLWSSLSADLIQTGLVMFDFAFFFFSSEIMFCH